MATGQRSEKMRAMKCRIQIKVKSQCWWVLFADGQFCSFHSLFWYYQEETRTLESTITFTPRVKLPLWNWNTQTSFYRKVEDDGKTISCSNPQSGEVKWTWNLILKLILPLSDWWDNTPSLHVWWGNSWNSPRQGLDWTKSKPSRNFPYFSIFFLFPIFSKLTSITGRGSGESFKFSWAPSYVASQF